LGTEKYYKDQNKTLYQTIDFIEFLAGAAGLKPATYGFGDCF